MRIVLTGTSLMPSYGGPAFSVSRLASALAESGVTVGLWAADQSASITPLLRPDAPVHRLIGTEAEALDSFGKIDLLHDNGIWLRHHHRLATLALKRGIPRIVSVRGMLEPWAINHRRWKKRIAWWLYQNGDLARVFCLHTTAEQEARHVRSLGLGVPVCTIPNGVDVPEVDRMAASRKSEAPRREGCRAALFLGRIHPKKGLPMLIEAWARIRPPDWVLWIAGPDEEGHRADLEKAVSAARLSQVISFLGPLDGPRKRFAFLDTDLLVLPTYSENFGMVVAEALAHGVPVLTTTGTPWSILPERECGWWVEATVDGIAEGLSQATSRDTRNLRAMGARGRDLMAAHFGWERIAKQFISAYEKLAAKSGLLT